MMYRALILGVLVGVCAAAMAGKYSPKQLSGPPEEFAEHVIPDPSGGAVVSRAATFWAKLAAIKANHGNATATSGTWSIQMPIDSQGFMFAVYSKQLAALKIELQDPSGANVPLADKQQKGGFPVGDSAVYDQAAAFLFPQTTASGIYTLTLTGTVSQGSGYDAYVSLEAESNDMLYTHLGSYESLVVGQQVKLGAKMYDEATTPRTLGFNPPAKIGDTILSAELEAHFPDGSWVHAPMHDDGLHDDGQANDGEYGGGFVATQAGAYTVQATFHGKSSNGEFLRVSEHLVSIVPQHAQLAGSAVGWVSHNAQRLTMVLLLEDNADTTQTLRAYTEVWGKSISTGETTAVAWSSAMVDIFEHRVGLRRHKAVALELDLQWLHRAGVTLPLTLKNAYLQDSVTFIPISTAKSLPLYVLNAEEFEAGMAARKAAGFTGLSISREMRQGIMPAHILNATASNSSPRLIMVHGYCSKMNPWLESKDSWPASTLYFADYEQSRSHDDFGKRVLDFAAANGVDQCAFIGHSQGGIVSSHILNNYFSCADANTQTGRVHTSLGSPYLGCTGAGSYADILAALGGCGSNFDMTPDGANLWQAGMSSDTWSRVHYYVTAPKPGKFGGAGYCNLLTNAVLNRPNDGVTEQLFAMPPAANNHGITLGECHIEGMNWPASFLNKNRNQEILSSMAL